MNAPCAVDSFRVAVVPTVKVANINALAENIPVSGTVVSCQRVYSIFFYEPVWCVEAVLDGGLKTYFGCKQDDLDAIGGPDKTGQSFTAVIGFGVGPSQDEMDVEPSTVWYLKDVRPGAARVMPMEVPGESQEMALRVA